MKSINIFVKELTWKSLLALSNSNSNVDDFSFSAYQLIGKYLLHLNDKPLIEGLNPLSYDHILVGSHQMIFVQTTKARGDLMNYQK